MADAVVAETLLPRKPVVSEGSDAQSIPLTLVVTDRETVAELLQRNDGRERDEYALAALRIGVLSLKHARGQIDADAVRHEGEKLLEDLRKALEPVYDLLSNRTRKARWTNCKLVLSFRSQFFHSLRHFSSQAKERSTTQRFGSTAKACSSLRLTTCTVACRRSMTPSAKGWPV